MTTMKEDVQKKVAEKKATIEKVIEQKTAEVKAAETEVKKQVKKAVKPAVKKAVAKTTTKATAVKKAVAASYNLKASIQFSNKEYSVADLEQIAKDVWVYDYENKIDDLNSIELYVKPEESKVYYVFNQSMAGSFDI